jgi:beta-lactamase superfamily II metal-dependent hydrolase
MTVFRTFGVDSPTPKLTSGAAKLGEINFAFVDMGQGDCTLISDAKNNVYVVDCGSIDRLPAESLDKAQKLLRKWAGDSKIELIITHPDQDHYNKFWDLLTGVEPIVLVKNIYFSYAKANDSPLGNYTVGYFSSNLHIFGNPDIVEVTINTTTDKIKTWQEGTNYKVPAESELVGEILELASGTVGEKAWSVKIIAGNVASGYISKKDKSNTASLVTLIQLGTLKLLLTGDSTSETFTYLATYKGDAIKDVDTFQVPHHGSETSIPESSFVDTVNPKSLIISVGLLNTSFFLPRKTIIDAWLKSKALRAGNLVIDYWVSGNKYYKNYERLQEITAVAWKGFKFDTTDSRTFSWLLNPDNAIGGTVFYGFSNKNYFLYRTRTDKELWITGIEGSLFDQRWV